MLKATLFLLAAGALWTAANADHLRGFLDAKARRDRELERVQTLAIRVARLRQVQTSLRIDGFETERAARAGLGMQLPGEQVIVIQRDANADAPAPVPLPDTEPVRIGPGRTEGDAADSVKARKTKAARARALERTRQSVKKTAPAP